MNRLTIRVAQLEGRVGETDRYYITDQPDGEPQHRERYVIDREHSAEEWLAKYVPMEGSQHND